VVLAKDSEYAIKNRGSYLRFQTCPPSPPRGRGGGADFNVIVCPSRNDEILILNIFS